MTVPIDPVPARPVDDAIIETGWGTWAHDNLLYAMRGRPKARVYRTGAQTIPNNAATAVSWQAERSGPSGLWVIGAPTRLTIVDEGWYMLGVQASFATNASGVRQLGARVNGTTTVLSANITPPPGAIFPVEHQASTMAPLNAGDYVELMAYQNSGGGLALEARAMISPEAWAVWMADL